MRTTTLVTCILSIALLLAPSRAASNPAPTLISSALTSLLKSASIPYLFIHIGQDLNELNDDRYCEKQSGCFFTVSLAAFPDLAARICISAPCSETALPISREKILDHINAAQVAHKFHTDDMVVTLNPKSAGKRETATENVRGTCVAAAGIATLVVVVVCMMLRGSKKEPESYLGCFNIVQNVRSVLVELPAERNRNLEIISWVRIVALGWMMLGHTIIEFLRVLGPATAPVYARIMTERKFTLLTAATVIADLFFTFSGFFAAVSCGRAYSRPENRSILGVVKAYVGRYMRLVPVYAVCILIARFVLPTIFTGEKYSVINNAECPNKWALNILLANNFVKMWDQCFFWSWFITNDMQFYLLVPILAICRWRSKTFAMALVALMAIGSCVVQTFLTYRFNLHLHLTDVQMLVDHFENYYIKPYCRVNPYLLGILLAWLWEGAETSATEGKKQTLGQKINALIIGSSVVRYMLYICGFTMVFAVFWVYPEFYLGARQSLVAASAYTVLSRPGFCLGMMCILYPAMLGKCRVLRAFLWPHRLWAAMSKLTYCVYILHIVLAAYFVATFEKGIEFAVGTIGRYFAGVFAVSYAVCFVISVAVEVPMTRVAKLCLGEAGKAKGNIKVD